MFFKETEENNVSYLKPILSDFEKEYLLNEIDMIKKNGGEHFVFDNFEANHISIYFDNFYIGTCSGILSNVLWELLATRIIIGGIYRNSYLDFALEGATQDLDTGHITLKYDPQKIKKIFLEDNFLKLILERKVRTDIQRAFIESIKK